MALQEWYQSEISVIQAELGDDVVAMDLAFKKLEERRRLRASSVYENYDEAKLKLQTDYWSAAKELESKKEAMITAELKEFGGDYTLAAQAAHAKYEREYKTLETTFQQNFNNLRAKYEMPPGEILIPKAVQIEESVLDEWWNRLQTLFKTKSAEIIDQAEAMINNPAHAQQQVNNLETVLNHKEERGEFIRGVDEGIFSWVKYVNVPGWYWNRVVLPWLENTFGWIRDKSWAARVRSIDPQADPLTFVNPDERAAFRTKNDYTAIFFAAITLALIGVLTKMAIIPIIPGLLGFLFVQARQLWRTAWGT